MYPNRNRRNALQSLLAPPGQLRAQQPRQNYVGGQRSLPGLIPYGPQPQGLQQNSRFTGGRVTNPMSLTEPPPPQPIDFGVPPPRPGSIAPPAPRPVDLGVGTGRPGGIAPPGPRPVDLPVGSSPPRPGSINTSLSPQVRKGLGITPPPFRGPAQGPLFNPGSTFHGPSAQQAPTTRAVTSALIALLSQQGQKPRFAAF